MLQRYKKELLAETIHQIDLTNEDLHLYLLNGIKEIVKDLPPYIDFKNNSLFKNFGNEIIFDKDMFGKLRVSIKWKE